MTNNDDFDTGQIDDRTNQMMPSTEPQGVSDAQSAANGNELLKELSAAFNEHLILADGAADAMALWVAHTYLYDAFDTTPRLAILSPEKRCGKTTLLKILNASVREPIFASNMTKAVLYRVIEKHRPTLLVDEADTFMLRDEEMIGVLNAGHTRYGQVWRCANGERDYDPTPFNPWAPIAIALIGTLPDTLLDRSVAIPMRRKREGEQVARLTSEAINETMRIASQLAVWISKNKKHMVTSDPEMPSGLDDRAEDNWLPLLAIADVVGADWPQRARDAALALSAGREDTSTGVVVLTAIRSIFATLMDDRISSKILCSQLSGVDEISVSLSETRDLAKVLKPYGIVPKVLRFGKDTQRGYLKDDFEDTFARYLPPEGVTSVTSVTSEPDDGAEDEDGEPGPSVFQQRVQVVPFEGATT